MDTYDLFALPRDVQPRTADDIKALARQIGVRNIEDLLALDRKQDPFYAPHTPTGKVHAHWFAELWDRCGYTLLWDVHLRRMHYKLVSAFRDLMTADTTIVDPARGAPSKPYENTEACFDYLIHASQLARASGLVDPARFADHRNPHVQDDGYIPERSAPSFSWDAYSWNWYLPELPTTLGTNLDFALPAPRAEGYLYGPHLQPYLLEVWIEKSTMDTILAPLTRSHGIRVVPSVGFQSITGAIKHLHRVARTGKPARIFYISDYDPAGAQMPSAVARQLQFWRDAYAKDFAIKLQPVALTKEQVEHYQLPRIPIKDSDNRKGRFEEVYGEGAVELDALEALYPGELLRIMRRILDPYVDSTLRERLSEAEDEANERLQEAWEEATTDQRDAASDLEEDARAVYARYKRVMVRLAARLERDLAPIRERAEALQEDIAEAQDAFEPPALECPEPDVAPEGEEDWLYSSDRDYLTQNLYYQARKQGRTVAELHAEAVRQKQAEEWAMMQASFPAGCPPFNTTRHKLGSLCKRGHAWGTTGQSLRSNRKIPTCLYCHAEDNYARRRTPDPGGASPQWVYDPTRSYLKPIEPGLVELGDASDDGDEDDA
jgi:hypothetical protein